MRICWIKLIIRQFCDLLGNPCDSMGNLFLCVVPIDRMNTDTFPTSEALGATSVAEDLILHASAPWFFPECLNNDSVVRSYLYCRSFFPSGLLIGVVTAFEWTSRVAIPSEAFVTSLYLPIMGESLVFSSLSERRIALARELTWKLGLLSHTSPVTRCMSSEL